MCLCVRAVCVYVLALCVSVYVCNVCMCVYVSVRGCVHVCVYVWYACLHARVCMCVRCMRACPCGCVSVVCKCVERPLRPLYQRADRRTVHLSHGDHTRTPGQPRLYELPAACHSDTSAPPCSSDGFAALHAWLLIRLLTHANDAVSRPFLRSGKLRAQIQTITREWIISKCVIQMRFVFQQKE